MTLFANVYMRYTLRAYVYEAEEKGFTCFDEINKLCTLLKLYLLLFVVKRVADRLVARAYLSARRANSGANIPPKLPTANATDISSTVALLLVSKSG